MAIRKMEFTQGEELNIRSCPRIETKYILENIDDLLKQEGTLIVKCGKSFWDVTNNRDIYNQAEEFDPQELTGIEKKEMQLAATSPLAHAYDGKDPAQDPMSMLYQKTEDDTEIEEEHVTRKTFYATDLVLSVIDTYRFRNGTEVSEAIRELILRGTPEDIMDEAKKVLEARAKNGQRIAGMKAKKRKNRVII